MNLIDTVLGSATEVDLNIAGRTRAKYVLHNHPNNASFSNKDIHWLLKNRNTKYFSIAKNNGSVETIYLPDNFDYKIFEIEYGRLIKKYKKAIEIDTERGYNKVINDLLSKTKSGLIYVR